MNIDEIIENFAVLDDWEDRYRYGIELGRALPPLGDSLKTDDVKVTGCASQNDFRSMMARISAEARAAQEASRGLSCSRDARRHQRVRIMTSRSTRRPSLRCEVKISSTSSELVGLYQTPSG